MCTKCGSVGHPFFSVPSEGKLIQDLQKDWKTRTLPRSRRQAEDDVNTAKVPTPPIWVWTRSRLSQKSPGDREGHEGKKEEKRDRRSRSRRRHSRRSQDKAEFNGKVMTLEVYLLKRRFFFLHLYSGPQDPLGGGFGEGCKEVQDEGDGGKLRQGQGRRGPAGGTALLGTLEQGQRREVGRLSRRIPLHVVFKVEVVGVQRISRPMQVQTTSLWTAGEQQSTSRRM